MDDRNNAGKPEEQATDPAADPQPIEIDMDCWGDPDLFWMMNGDLLPSADRVKNDPPI